MSVLEITDLVKSYRRGFIPKTYEVLKGVTFKLPHQTITAFLGANGAGKTTTFKCMLGLAYPSAGTINYFGGQPLSNAIKKKIGFLPERPYFYDYLTGGEFLRFYGELSLKIKRQDLESKIDALLKKVDLFHAKNKKLKEYSKGMLQKIGVAQALIHDPELVILDEPMSGLDPDGRMYLSELIQQIGREGRCVFFSSHLLNDAEALCERLVILTGGKVSYQGSTDEFVSRMGEKSLITYIARGEKKHKSVETNADLQIEIQNLIKDGATIDSIRKDRNLEQAFIKMGLRS